MGVRRRLLLGVWLPAGLQERFADPLASLGERRPAHRRGKSALGERRGQRHDDVLRRRSGLEGIERQAGSGTWEGLISHGGTDLADFFFSQASGRRGGQPVRDSWVRRHRRLR